MVVFNVNVEDNNYFIDELPSKLMDRACVEKQRKLFGDKYVLVNFDHPIVIKAKEEHHEFYEDCKKINRLNTFANLVRFLYMQEHFKNSDEPILYLDTDMYLYDNWHIDRADGTLPEFGIWHTGFAIVYAERSDEIDRIVEYYDKYNGNAWDYVDRRVTKALGGFSDLSIHCIHFTTFHKEQTDTDNESSPFHGHYDFWCNLEEEAMPIIMQEWDRPVKIFTNNSELMALHQKGKKLIFVPDDIVMAAKRTFMHNTDISA